MEYDWNITVVHHNMGLSRNFMEILSSRENGIPLMKLLRRQNGKHDVGKMIGLAVGVFIGWGIFQSLIYQLIFHELI